jgi:hypothetical protein
MVQMTGETYQQNKPIKSRQNDFTETEKPGNPEIFQNRKTESSFRAA